MESELNRLKMQLKVMSDKLDEINSTSSLRLQQPYGYAQQPARCIQDPLHDASMEERLREERLRAVLHQKDQELRELKQKELFAMGLFTEIIFEDGDIIT